MMGHQYDAQPKLFYHSFTLDDRIPATSVLRKIRNTLILNLSIRKSKTATVRKGMSLYLRP